MTEDEELHVGPRRRVPRWLAVALAAVVLAGVVVAVVTTRGADDPGPTAGQPAPDAFVDAVAADHRTGRFYRLAAERIVASDRGGRVLATSGSTGASTGISSRTLLLVDEQASLVWTVPVGGTTPGSVRAFDARTLHREREVALPDAVTAAAPSDGGLLVAGPDQLQRLRRTGSGWAQTGLPTAESLAADPVHGHVLTLFLYGELTLGTITDTLTHSVPYPGATATLAVAGGTAWAVGTGPAGALVVPLGVDVPTPGPAVPGFGDSAELVGVGDRSLFVRGSDGTVACLDSSTGITRQSFPGLRGDVVATHGAALVRGGAGPARPLALAGCPG